MLRFLPFKNKKFTSDGVWFHACSFGEVSSLTQLVNTIKDDYEVSLSVITKTGFDKAKILIPNVRFLPFEIFLPFWITKQKVLVVTEAELWLALFYISKQKGARTILINARVSDNSYYKYLRFKWFYKKLFLNIDEVFAQSDIDAKRLNSLGAKNIKVVGNLKSMHLPKVTKNYNANLPYSKVITLASTHIGEESMILKQLNNISLEDTMVVIAPRHPERFEAIHKLAQSWANSKGKTYSRLSKDGFDEPSDVMLCDVMGDLINIYAITNITILGGSFIEGVGGHNPIEPAHFNNIIISGPFFHNQKELYLKVENIYICNSEEIAKTIKKELSQAHIKQLDDNNIIVDSILKTLK